MRWESSVGSCVIVFVAHHFIKLALISNIESLGINALEQLIVTDSVDGQIHVLFLILYI